MSTGNLVQFETLISAFPTHYTFVVHHARMGGLTCREIQSLSPNTMIVGEFVAAAGYEKINFKPLQSVIAFADKYLETGAFDTRFCGELINTLSPVNQGLLAIAHDMVQAGVQDDSAHIPPFLYAHNSALILLMTCHEIERNTPPQMKPHLLGDLAKRKRLDTDPDCGFSPAPA